MPISSGRGVAFDQSSRVTRPTPTRRRAWRTPSCGWNQYYADIPCAVTVVPTKSFATVGGIVEINLIALTNGAARKYRGFDPAGSPAGHGDIRRAAHCGPDDRFSIETLGLVADELGLDGDIWNVVNAANDNFGALGYAIIGVFVASWLISLVVYRVMGYDKRGVVPWKQSGSRDDAVSGRGQSGDDAGCQGMRIATRCFVDRVRDDPLDGRAIAFRHPALPCCGPCGANTPRIPPLPTAGWPPLVNRPICGR